MLTGLLGLIVVVCAALTAQRQSQNSNKIQTLLATEQQNAIDLKEERKGRKTFEDAFFAFTKTLDPSKFTVRQYVSYRQAQKASSPPDSTEPKAMRKTSPPSAAIAAIKKDLDLGSMKVIAIGGAMPDKREDAHKRLAPDPFSPFYRNATTEQLQKMREDYFAELDRLDAVDATRYKALEVDLKKVLWEAFTMLDLSDSERVAEFAKLDLLSASATSSTNRSENSSPHQKDYAAIATYLGSIANRFSR